MSLRTTAVGSWPIPFGLKRYLTAYYKGDLDDNDAFDVLQRAARIAMDEQMACGLDQIMGGEVFAPDFVHHVPPRLAGLEQVKRRDHRAGGEGIGRYRIIGEISAPNGTGHAKAYRREKAIEPMLDKAAVPSPLTMTISFPEDPALSDQMENIATMVELEVKDMAAAGAREVQLDAPAEAVAALTGAQGLDDIAHWLSFPFRSTDKLVRTVHFCLGDMGRRPATRDQHLHNLIPLLVALDGHIDRAHIECSYDGQWVERELLAKVPESMEVIAGIADVKSKPQSVLELQEKVTALLQVIPPERLLLSSSCGCGRVPHDDAIAMMVNLVKAARAV